MEHDGLHAYLVMRLSSCDRCEPAEPLFIFTARKDIKAFSDQMAKAKREGKRPFEYFVEEVPLNPRVKLRENIHTECDLYCGPSPREQGFS